MRGVRQWRGFVALMSFAMGALTGCPDDATSADIDSEVPATISQDRMDGRCVVLDGRLTCWASAEIDDGTKIDRYQAVYRAILQRDVWRDGTPFPSIDLGGGDILGVACSAIGCCAAVEDGRVRCWGDNTWHHLGVPDPEIRSGDDANERGSATNIVDLGDNFRAIQVSLGRAACARSDEGRVKCWGSLGDALGLGAEDGRGDGVGEMGDVLPHVDLGDGVLAAGLTSGNAHTCIWTVEGRVKCWGENSRGQLGISSSNDIVGDEPGEMGDALPYVDLGPDARVIQVSAAAHTCVLTDVGKVKCWGANSTPQDLDGNPLTDEVPTWFGRLGSGDREDRRAPLVDLPDVDLGDGFDAQAVVARQWSSCAVSVDRRLKCWGAGPIGQGLLDEAIGDEPGEMGDDLPYVDLGRGRTVRMIDSTSAHCLMLDDDSVRCWTGPDRPLVGDEIPPTATHEDFYGP